MPRSIAPADRVTLRQAAKLSGLSYQRVYQIVAAGAVPSERDHLGRYTLAAADVALLQRRPAAGDKRRAVMLRVSLERYAAWERAAGDKPVSTWLAELADAASR